LRSIVAALDNDHIRRLLDSFLDDSEVATRYRSAPAAKSIHHAFRGGLLEHVLSLAKLAKLISGHYASVDLNLLIAGVVLHDIGKIHELSYERAFGYSAEGQLVGHIAIAIRMLSDKLRAFPEFPVELRNLIEHMILSHHGQLEFGSPKVPVFPEALLLHHLDDMDSKMECMRALIDKEPQSTGYFTGYSSSLARVALRKARYLESRPGACAPDPGLSADEPDGAASDASRHEASISRNSPPDVTSAFPGRTPSPAPPIPKPAPAPNSIFGLKLQQALHDERK
jgi:3'-5' exoribonuclease